MSKSMKAALLSAFLFPGAGHFYLKDYISGAVLAGAAIASLYYLITKAFETALQITEKIQNGEVQPDIAVITELVSKQSTGPEAQVQAIATFVLIISWLIGIIGSFRLGHTQEKGPD